MSTSACSQNLYHKLLLSWQKSSSPTALWPRSSVGWRIIGSPLFRCTSPSYIANMPASAICSSTCSRCGCSDASSRTWSNSIYTWYVSGCAFTRGVAMGMLFRFSRSSVPRVLCMAFFRFRHVVSNMQIYTIPFLCLSGSGWALDSWSSNSSGIFSVGNGSLRHPGGMIFGSSSSAQTSDGGSYDTGASVTGQHCHAVICTNAALFSVHCACAEAT